jgi:hypothetical protein
MIECPHCHYEWKVRHLVAKGLSRCPRCQTELDLSTFLLDQIGGTLAAAEAVEWRWALKEPPLDDLDALLNDYLPTALGLRIPDWPICDHHNTPGDFMRVALAMGDDGRPENGAILYVTTRAGAKSHNLSLVEWLKTRKHDGFEAKILGGSWEQSHRCYEHSLTFWDGLNGKFYSDLQAPPTEHRTRLKNRSSIATLKASERSVRGSRVNDLALDELDEIPRAIYQAAISQRIRGKRDSIGGHQFLMASSINRAGGLVEEKMAEYEKSGRGRKMIVYCWKEVTATCTIEGSCIQCPLHVHCRGDLRKLWDCVVVSVDEDIPEVMIAREHNGRTYKTAIWRDDIEDCPASLEPGDRVQVRGNPHGYLDARDVAEVWLELSDETIDSEWNCNLKQPLGAVLKRAHIDRCTKELRFSREEPFAFDRKAPHTWLCIDWGYRNETCVVGAQWDGKLDLRLFSEAHWQEKTGDELAELITAIGDRYTTTSGPCRLAYADASDPDKIKALRQRGWTVKPVAFGAWKNRCLEALRVWLQGRGGKNLSINRNCTHLTKALIAWKYKDEVTDEDAERAIVKKDDHPCDAVLAGMRRFAKKKSPTIKPNKPDRANTPEEMYRMMGMPTAAG